MDGSKKKIEKNISLREYNTLKIDVVAPFFCTAQTIEDLYDICLYAKEKKLTLVFLGGGSNILFPDVLKNTLVVHIALRGIEEGKVDKRKVRVVVYAGESWDHFVAWTVKQGLYGIENLSGIPGTVGAAPVQNVGAYGMEVSDTIEWVEVFNKKTKKLLKLSKEECQFKYRESIFKNKNNQFIIVRVSFLLTTSSKLHLDYKDVADYFHELNIAPNLKNLRKAILKIRSRKFPSLKIHGTAGSFFKNPIITKEHYKKLRNQYPGLPAYVVDEEYVKVPLAWILDSVCHLKGFHKNNITLFKRQPLVLVTNGKATSKEIKIFSKEIIKIIKEKTFIDVEPEVTFLK